MTFNVVSAWLEAQVAMRSLNLVLLLSSLESLKGARGDVLESSRVIGQLVAIQEKFVGGLGLADILAARRVCEWLCGYEDGLYAGRTSGARFEHGIVVAGDLGWIGQNVLGEPELTCVFHEQRSLEAVTRKFDRGVFGLKWLKGLMYAEDH